jgi:predicted  nucleic acid-binding Zn-ribbon protein
LRDQLELLWEIQKIDLDLRQIRDDQDRFPREIRKLDEKQSIEKERLQKEKEKIESLEKERRQKESHLTAEIDRIKKAEGKMFEVKTNKEYQALLNEMEAVKTANNREEEAILQILEEIDELRKGFSKKEKELVAAQEKIEAERKTIQERMTQNDALLKKEMERRDALSKQLESRLSRLYNTLKEKRQGIGVVTVSHETCQGCFVHIPPQMFIEVQKNEDLIRCPNCNRILYWEEGGKTK